VTPNNEDPPVMILPKAEASETRSAPANPTREVGGRPGPEPTRYGDWEFKGRCIDF
jgi:shikimate dehydrogenase